MNTSLPPGLFTFHPEIFPSEFLDPSDDPRPFPTYLMFFIFNES